MSTDASNYDLQNVECQSLIPSSKILSRSPRFTKRAITNISDVFRRRLCLRQPARRHVVSLSVASQCFQIAMFANFPTSFSFYSCVIMDGNPAFTVHVTRVATFDVTTSDVMFSEFFLMFDVYAMNLKLKRIFMKM